MVLSPEYSFGVYDVSVLVTAVWKGTPAGVVHVFTESDLASCGFRFFEDNEYIIFTDNDSWTNICTFTWEAEGSFYEEIIAAIGSPVVPVKAITWSQVKALFR